MKNCSVAACPKPSSSRGWCTTHYTRWRRHGTIMAGRPSIEQRLWRRVRKGPNCWNWEGSTTHGYGYIYWKGRLKPAHRVAYQLTYGDIPAEMFICHHCDNRRCVRPDHLFIGTRQDNMDDAVTKHRFVTGERHNFAKLKAVQVQQIRELCKGGMGLKEIALQFGIVKSNVHHIVKRHTWKWLSPQLPEGPRRQQD